MNYSLKLRFTCGFVRPFFHGKQEVDANNYLKRENFVEQDDLTNSI